MIDAEKQGKLTGWFFDRVNTAIEGLETAKKSLLSRVTEAMVAEVAANSEATAKSASKTLADKFPALSSGTEAVYRSWSRKAIERHGEAKVRAAIDADKLDEEAFRAAVVALCETLAVRPAKEKDKAPEQAPQALPEAEATPQLELHTVAASALRELQTMVEAGDETAVAHVNGLALVWADLQRAMQGHEARKAVQAAEARKAKRTATRAAKKAA